MRRTLKRYSARQTFRQLRRFVKTYLELILICSLIVIAAVQYFLRPQSQTLEQILDSKQLRVLIVDEPDSLYEFNQQQFGFEYEFLQAFADDLDVDLRLDVVPYGELFTLLSAGQADLAVGGIIDSPYVRRVSTPSLPWYKAQTTVVYERGTKRPKNIEDLEDQPVFASARYFEIDILKQLNLVDDHRSEYQLLSAVNRGDKRFALSTNYRARNAKHYLPNLNRAFILNDTLDVVWSLPERADPALLERLNQFIRESVAAKKPESLADSYFKRPPRLSTFDGLAIHKKIDTVLPDFEFAFRKAARKASIDWHLLAAMAYQESRWSNNARSPTGVRGLMQLTSSTAEQLGVTDRLDMSQSIDAAARYLKNLRQRLPKSIKEPQRTWFAVAAYNVGLKHVLAAYRKADSLGVDKNKWSVVAPIFDDLYGSEFPQGKQAQTYVKRVQIFTDIIRFYDLHQRREKPLKPGVVVSQTTAAS